MNEHIDNLLRYFEENTADEPRTATIVLPLTWPDVKNAEYEVVKRFCRAASNIGARIIVTNNDGYPYWTSDNQPIDTSRPIDRRDADFMISLHFETPRLIDIPSYYAVWQPISFYFDFGYNSSTEKLLTHTNMLSCSSDLADAHVRNLRTSLGQEVGTSYPYLFHSPAEPYYAPAITADARLFYIGINWERLGQSGKGRHQELLRLLDEADLIDIYGPRMFLGLRPWEGYKTYRGELPFDGVSVVRALAASGICLAMSSSAHQHSGIMSNRLFEGLAAGSAIIANPHPIIDKYFSDIVWQIDDTLGDEEIFHQISAAIQEIRADPEAANARAFAGQKRLQEMFSLERCLQAIIDQHAELEQVRSPSPDAAHTTIILPYNGLSEAPLIEVLRGLEVQEGIEIHLVLACSKAFAEGSGRACIASARDRLARVTVLIDVFGVSQTRVMNTGAAIVSALAYVDTETFAIVRPGEDFFHDHFAILERRLRSTPDAMAIASGLLDEGYESVRRRQLIRRKVVSLNVTTDPSYLIEKIAEIEPGCFLFRTSLLGNEDLETLRLIDGCEVSYLLLLAQRSVPIMRSGQATCIRIPSEVECHQPNDASLVYQKQYIVDRLRFDPIYQKILKDINPRPAAIAGAPKSFGEKLCPRLFLDKMVFTNLGGEGVECLVEGFSAPEGTATWINGETGLLKFCLGDLQREDRDLDLILRLAGRTSQITGRPQHATIAVNGVTIAYLQLAGAVKEFTLRLPTGIRPLDILRVRITADHAEPVVDPNGAVIDSRRLGIFVAGVGVFRGQQSYLLPELPVGLDVPTSRLGAGMKLLRENFFPDEIGAWVTDGPARLAFRLAQTNASAFSLTLLMKADPVLSASEPLDVNIMFNGVRLDVIPVNGEATYYNTIIPSSLAGGGTAWSVQLVPELEGRERTKFGVRTLALLSLRVDAERTIKLGSMYDTNIDGEGVHYLVEGFSKPEANLTWIDGMRGTIVATIDLLEDAKDIQPMLILNIGGRRRSSGGGQIFAIEVNGVVVGEEEVGPGVREFVLPISNAVKSAGLRKLVIVLKLKEPVEQVVDASSGEIVDDRWLGIFVTSFGVLARETS